MKIERDIIVLVQLKYSQCLWKHKIHMSKAIADKIDAGCIMLDVSQEDLEILAPVTNKLGVIPNVKMSVYKNRGNKYNNILVWYRANKGIARFEPLFVTNYQYELLEDIPQTEITIE